MNNLSIIRETKGLSQRDLAEMLKVSQPTIQRAETEDDSAKLGTYKKCAAALGVTLEDIFSSRDQTEARLLELFKNVPIEKVEQAASLLDFAKTQPPTTS